MKPFNPEPLPPNDLRLEGLVSLVGRANAVLSRYDGLLESVVNPDVMLSPLLMKEAELSSRIEGTVATANEVYQQQAGEAFEPEKEADIQEILNYRRTLRLATEVVTSSKDPLSLHLIRQMHATLMEGVRGSKSNPGKFRAVQNWIGPKGCKLEEALYVPPPPERVSEHLDRFAEFLAGRHEDIDPIVQSGMIHAQFEMVHPFDDGNGRIGRLLIPLFLTQRESLVMPSFYISRYFEEHRDQYHFRLGAISRDGDWLGWIRFYLDAVVHQASHNLDLVREIKSLYEQKKLEITELLRTEFSIHLLDFFFDSPVFSAPDIHQSLNIQRQRAAGYLRQLVAAGFLTELRPASGKRGALLSFEPLWNITDRQ